MSGENKGLIWDIQRFNIHDGPGIRTLIFFKGCPLKCLWCANPEGQGFKPEILIDKDKCVQSGDCIEVCKFNAIRYSGNIPMIDKQRCTLCGDCVEVCNSGALKIVGTEMTVDEVMSEVIRDESYFRKSGGGITLTGGEPLVQADFIRDLFKAAKEYYLDTAIETCGHTHWEQFEKVIPYTNTFLFDIKNLDPMKHKEQTGVSNELILENVNKLAGVQESELILRTPIIPGKNDDDSNLKAIAELAAKLGVKQWDIIAYHQFGEGKYKDLGRNYPLKGLQPPIDLEMQDIIKKLKPIYPGINLLK